MKVALSLRTLGVVCWALPLSLPLSLLGCLALASVARADASGSSSNPSANASPPTIDDVATSHEHFSRGVDYVHDGDLRGALIEFKRAYAVSPNYRVLFNLGQVANALGRYTEAQEYFQRYLNDGQD
jgi:tetratricopeptide (TPR) repeat protein